MKKVIINADDFGYSQGVSYGIIESYRRGVLTSTSIMPSMPGFEHAVGLARQNPGLGIGVHLTLTCGYPLLSGHKTLVREDGSFPRKPFYIDESTSIDLDEAEREWTAQIERVLDAGIAPDHLDAHHHIYTYKGLERLFYDLAYRYGLPVRHSWGLGDEYEGPHVDTPGDIAHPETMVDYITPAHVNFADSPQEYLRKISVCLRDQLVKKLEEHDVVEVMCHPAYVDYPVIAGSSFNVPRCAEVEVMTDPTLRTFIRGLGAELITFAQIS